MERRIVERGEREKGKTKRGDDTDADSRQTGGGSEGREKPFGTFLFVCS